MQPRLGQLDRAFSKVDTAHVFDFSRFFRLYPLMFREKNGKLNTEEALKLILNPDLNFTPSPSSRISENARGWLKNYTVSSSNEFQPYIESAKKFIQDYHTFLNSTLKETNQNIGDVIINAYITNENRTYLDYNKLDQILVRATQAYQARHISSQQLQSLVKNLTEANDRRPISIENGEYRCNLRLFQKGV